MATFSQLVESLKRLEEKYLVGDRVVLKHDRNGFATEFGDVVSVDGNLLKVRSHKTQKTLEINTNNFEPENLNR